MSDDEFFHVLVRDLKNHARHHRLLSSQSHNSTRRQAGESLYADYCHILGDAHEKAAEVYTRVAEEVEAKHKAREKEGS